MPRRNSVRRSLKKLSECSSVSRILLKATHTSVSQLERAEIATRNPLLRLLACSEYWRTTDKSYRNSQFDLIGFLSWRTLMCAFNSFAVGFPISNSTGSLTTREQAMLQEAARRTERWMSNQPRRENSKSYTQTS